jgi:GrpB-like predicted nucleotidyltransferase (UPF0157 family)
MMEHCEEAEAYASLKEELPCQFTYDAEQYVAGKDLFIKEIEKLKNGQ